MTTAGTELISILGEAAESAGRTMRLEDAAVLGMTSYILLGFLLAGGVFLFMLVFTDMSDWFGGKWS